MRTSGSIWHIFFILCIFSISFAQAPDTLWTKRYGGKCGYAVRQTFDNGYFVAGQKISSGRDHIWLLRTDEDGDTLWTRIYGDTTASSTAYDMQITPDGGCIIIGNYGLSLFLLRIDRFGDTLWTKKYGEFAYAVGYSIEKTSDGGFIIAGSDISETYLWLLKTDANGDTTWTQRYASGNYNVGYSVRQTTDGGYIIAGRTASPSGIHLYIVKTNSAGNPLWTRTFLDTIAFDEIVSVVETFDSGYIVAVTTSYYLPREAVFIKIEANGDSIWCQIYGSPYVVGSGLHCIEKTADSNYIATGYYHSSADTIGFWILKIDDYGDTLWTITLGGIDFTSGYAVQQTQDGGYIAVGGDDDGIWIIKTESDVGIKEVETVETDNSIGATIFSEPLLLPEGKKCRVFDITGRIVEPDKITRGIYFIEIDGVVTQKVVRVR